MKVVAVDDERLALEAIGDILKKVLPDADIHLFRRGTDVISYLDEGFSCDIAFVDIEMRGMHGIECAEKIKAHNSRANIIFTTGYSEYMPEAFALHASGYLLKPITEEKVRRELADLRCPVEDLAPKKKLVVRAFGNFEVFCEGEPLRFLYSKTKELFAYLVDRCGAMCTVGEVESILWEDEDAAGGHRSYLNNLRSDLLNTLAKIDAQDCVILQRGALAVNKDLIDCDYYDWLEGKTSRYLGEYMSQYSWSETTHAAVEMKS